MSRASASGRIVSHPVAVDWANSCYQDPFWSIFSDLSGVLRAETDPKTVTYCDTFASPESVIHSGAMVYTTKFATGQQFVRRAVVGDRLGEMGQKAVAVFPRANSKKLSLLETIRSFYSLKENWDGEGAAKPSARAVNNADYFLQNLDDNTKFLPKIFLANDGEISFAWQTDAIHLDVGMVGDDTYYFYGEGPNGETFREASRNVVYPLPKEIANLLK